MEEPGRLQSMGLQGVRHSWATEWLHFHFHGILQKHFQILISQRSFFKMFSSWCNIILDFKFRSIFHFDLNLINSVKYSYFNRYSIDMKSFVESRILSPLNCFYICVINHLSLYIDMSFYFRNPFSVSLIYMSIFMPIPQ